MPATFVLNYLRTPRLIGSIAPSSKTLAEAMAEEVGAAQHIVELGGGTGAITEALRRRHANTSMTLFEQNEALARLLQTRFPDIDLVVGLLHRQTDSLEGLPDNTVMVSSLPFRAFDTELRETTVSVVCRFLAKNLSRKLVQYTYLPQAPFVPDHADLSWRRRKVIVRNLPPAYIWELQLEK